MKKILALLLAAALLLTGCDFLEWDREMVSFADMEYTRPDLTDFREYLEECCTLAEEGTDLKALEDAIWDLFIEKSWYETNYALADIHYCQNTSDIYWTDEYNYCMETASEVQAGLDRLFYLLADCPFREDLETDEFFGADFFDDYDGESLWDDSFTALMEEETALLTEYYDRSATLMEQEYGTAAYDDAAMELVDLYVELIELRQRIAADAEYEDYHHFAYDFYYARDYTPEQETAYLEAVREQLVPLYRNLYEYGVEGLYYYECSETEAYAYVEGIAEAMGSSVAEAFDWMTDAGLYDITYSENKYNASFEIFLSDYYVPFVFMNPEGTSYDKLTFSHEFGHFCNDFASYGSVAGIDVAEVFSQGMEYLGLIYAEDSSDVRLLSMVSSLCVQVQQSAYADFEQRVYRLEGDDLTAENVIATFAAVATDYGFDVHGIDTLFFASVPHFFTNPMYVFSYVVSNDAAMQLYQLELAEPGAGLAMYQESLTSEESYFLAFLEEAGLESPFAEGRMEALAQTYADIWK